MTDEDERFWQHRLQYLTWERQQSDIEDPAHLARRAELERRAGATFAKSAYVAADAAVFTDNLVLGENSWIAGHALVRGDVEFGAHCTVNSFACISGKVRCGDGVRIASHVTIVGFNHGFEDKNVPIYTQAHDSQGITIKGDAWIGANAVILDGVTIGHGVVVAAGAVVSRDVPDNAIVAGVPAKVVRLRGQQSAQTQSVSNPEAALGSLDKKAASQWRDVLKRNFNGERYVSREGDGTERDSIRHLCDAVEIAASFDARPEEVSETEALARLEAVQDPETGLFPDPFRTPDPNRPLRDDGLALYNILAVGYALEVLGSRPQHKITAVELSAPDLYEWLESLPWRERAWGAGAAIDAIGTGLYFNARYFETGRTREALFGWLALNVDRSMGVWGSPTAAEGLVQPVNGFYRLTRGTYAQFGLPVPRAEAAIDTVLKNYRDYAGFSGRTYTACNLLDTIHPLMLCLDQTDHRRAEAEAIAADIILRAPERWIDGEGFAFADGQPASLQGTEMWLSVIHLAAKVLGIEDGFSFVPKGVHRTKAVGLGL
nr:acyltransferase [Devosia pacifica]